MTGEELQRELEQLHAASFGWALTCCRWDREQAVAMNSMAQQLSPIGRGQSEFFRLQLMSASRRETKKPPSVCWSGGSRRNRRWSTPSP